MSEELFCLVIPVGFFLLFLILVFLYPHWEKKEKERINKIRAEAFVEENRRMDEGIIALEERAKEEDWSREELEAAYDWWYSKFK